MSNPTADEIADIVKPTEAERLEEAQVKLAVARREYERANTNLHYAKQEVEDAWRAIYSKRGWKF